ncbi:MAG: sulfatase-like hydrolase/transferase [Thermoanaerobaculia bacterium]
MSSGPRGSRGIRWLVVAVGAGVVGLGAVVLWRHFAAPPTAGEAYQRFVAERLAGPPNLVLITVDTLRADRLSSYGYRDLETPHIDRLARQGVRFTNAASTIPFTLPAHSSILTGTYPPHHGVRENVGYALDESLDTLAERLGRAGYTTAGFVSAFVLDARWGIAQGFEHYDDDFAAAAGEPRLNLASVQRLGGDTAAAAIRWLKDDPPQPFFLWLHLFDPHDPYAPPEPFRSRYRQRPYDGEVAYTDSLIGALVRAMRQTRLLERSVVVFTGDHGEGLGDHAEGFHGFFVYDSTVRVPLVVRLPDGAYGGRTVGSAVSHVDLVPTLLETAGLVVPADLQGRSLLPLLVDRTPDERGVYSESTYPRAHYGWAPLIALRTDRFKLIEAPRPELYDVIADPGERHNLMEEQPDVARRLRRQLHELASRLERPQAAGARPDLDADTLRRLQALGYVAGRGEVAGDGVDDGERADPKDKIRIHQLVMLAQSDLGHGDREAATRRLEQVLAEDAHVLDAHQMLGVLAAEQGRPEEALEHFQRALALDADHTPSLFGLATAYRGLGRLEEALVGYLRLQTLAPHDSKAALATVEILVEQDRLEEALAAVVEAASAPQAPALVHNQRGELLVLLGRRGEAESALQRALDENPDLAQPYFNLAVLAEERGEGGEAIRLYQETIARAPHHYRAQFNLGRLHGRRGEREQQRRLYQAAIESNPDFVEGYYYLAKLLMDSGDNLTRAEDLVRAGLAREQGSGEGPLGHYLLADILNRRGRPAEAAAAAQRGRQLEAGIGR